MRGRCDLQAVHQEDGLTVANEILDEIKKTRERVNHFKKIRNEPGGGKKLGRWRRRLGKAIKQARERGLTIPPDPYAPPPPPPPPPTEEELHAAAVKEAKARVSFEWQICVGAAYWAPWGPQGWSAVVVTKLLGHIWCRADRVNPSTGEVAPTKGRVRRDRLVKRDPALKGKDRPAAGPDEIVPLPEPDEPDEPDEPEPELAPEPRVEQPEKIPETGEERAARAERLTHLLDLMIDDKSTTSDW